MNPASCPDRENLLGYALGKLSEQASDAIAAHLDICPDCENTLAGMDQVRDTLVEHLGEPAAQCKYIEEPQCAEALRRVKAMAGTSGLPGFDRAADEVTQPPARELADDPELALERQIDEACDAFEAVWKGGGEPRIEEFLESLPPAYRGEALTALLRVELDWRRTRQQTVAPEPYYARFPEFRSQIDAAFAQMGAPAAPPAPLPKMLGEYELLGKLGEGGMGAVYKARQKHLKKLVALKLLPKDRMSDPQARARFEREMEAVGRVDHPNVVRAMDAREIDGTTVLAMEYVEGLDLSQVVYRFGQLPIADACELIRQAALGLQAAHEEGLVHRDIKPSNLMLAVQGGGRKGEGGGHRDLPSPAGRGAGGEGGVAIVKILDLGLARLSTDRPAEGELTSENQAMGTADYMAPEQAGDAHWVDIRADIYALGCTLYKLLTAEAPFHGPKYKTSMQKIHAHLYEPVPPVRLLRPDVPDGLVAVLDRMLAKDPAERFALPVEVAAAMGPFTAGADLASVLATARDLVKAHVHAAKPRAFTEPVASSAGTRTPAGALGSAAVPAAIRGQDARAPVSPPGEAPRVYPGVRASVSPLPLGEGQGVRAAELSTTVPRAAARRRKLPALAIALAVSAAAIIIALAITIRIRDRSGQETVINVPEGSQVTVKVKGEGGTGKADLKSQISNLQDPRPKTQAPSPANPWTLPPGAPLPAFAPFDAEKAKEHQQAWAKHLGVPVETTNLIGMKLVLVPRGEFSMGDGKKSPRVTITKPFYLGKYEVTQEEWMRVMGGNPSKFKGPKNPVETVSWEDCQEFLKKLGEKCSLPEGSYRLPTEAEWEYACRAGSMSKWCFGDDESELGDYAWYKENSEGQTHLVGEKKPNAWGLYDMHGNVGEWCADWFDKDYFKVSPGSDPTGPSAGVTGVDRGGHWNLPARGFRSGDRNGNAPGFRHETRGLRASLLLTDSFLAAAAPPGVTLQEKPASASNPPESSGRSAMGGGRTADIKSPISNLKSETPSLQAPRPKTQDPPADESPDEAMPDEAPDDEMAEDAQPAPPIPLPTLPGCGLPISPLALVARPKTLPGLKSWSVETRRHHALVQTVEYSPDGRWIATAGDDGTVRIRQAATGEVVRTLLGHNTSVIEVAWSPDSALLASAAEGDQTRVWDVQSGRLLREVSPGASVAWSPDGHVLAVGNKNYPVTPGVLSLHDLQTGRVKTHPARGSVEKLNFSFDGRLLVWKGERGTVRALELSSGIQRVLCQNTVTGGLAVHPREYVIAVAVPLSDKTRAIHLYDAATGEKKREWKIPDKPGWRMTFSADGQEIAVDGGPGVYRWKTASGEALPPLEDKGAGKGGGLRWPSWSSDGKRIAAGGCGLRIFDADTGKVVYRDVESIGVPPCRGVAFSPDGKSLAVNWDKCTHIFPMADPAKVRKIQFPGLIGGLAWSPDSTRLAITTFGDGVNIVKADLQGGEPKPAIPDRLASRVAWSPDGSRLACWLGAGTCRPVLYHFESRQLITVEGEPGRIGDLAWSPDGKFLAAGRDRSLCIWNGQNGKRVGEITQRQKSDNASVVKIVWSANGKVVAGADTCTNIHIWDVENGKPLPSQKGWIELARSVALSPTGDKLFVSRVCGRLTNVTSGEQLAPFKLNQSCSHAEFWNDDSRVVCTGELGRRMMLEAATGRVIEEQQGPAFRCENGFDRQRILISRSTDVVASIPSGHDTFGHSIHLWQASTGLPVATILIHNDEPVVFSPDGHWSSKADVAKDLVYVAQTEDGTQTMLSPEEFTRKYGWKNEPARVGGGQ